MTLVPRDPTAVAGSGPACGRPGKRRGLFSWALFGWANSPLPTLIVTFIFPAYFSRALVGDEVRGQALWGYGIAVSSLVLALVSPLLGAIADAAGRRKPWLFGFSALCIGACAALWFVQPGPGAVTAALLLVGLANIGYGFGVVFSNAMLPDLVPADRVGRWSGWAWALGYAGGLAALVIALLGFVNADRPWFGLGAASGEQVRVIGPLVAFWFVLFGWPIFAFTADHASSGLGIRAATPLGIKSLGRTLRTLRSHGNILRFLLAQMIVSDGLVAVFTFGGVYAAGAFHMTIAEVTGFGILLNVTAGLGTLAFAWVDDWLGSKPTLLISLAGLIAASTAAILVDGILWFWIAGGILGFFVGPPQSASRSLMARLAPVGQETQFFGLYALSGRSTAFMGPAVVGTVTALFDSQRVGLASLIAFFIVGFIFMLGVVEPAAKPRRP
jgi:MFS transporter, UMF1 family